MKGNGAFIKKKSEVPLLNQVIKRWVTDNGTDCIRWLWMWCSGNNMLSVTYVVFLPDIFNLNLIMKTSSDRSRLWDIYKVCGVHCKAYVHTHRERERVRTQVWQSIINRSVGASRQRVNGCCWYYSCNFSVGLKFFNISLEENQKKLLSF